MMHLIKLGNPGGSEREGDYLNFIHYESKMSS